MCVKWIRKGCPTFNPSYPLTVKNINGVEATVKNREEHLAHLLVQSGKRGSDDYSKLLQGNYPIQDYVSDDAKLLHSIFADVKRYGISWLYHSIDDIPAIVKWGIDYLQNLYDKEEQKELDGIKKGTKK